MSAFGDDLIDLAHSKGLDLILRSTFPGVTPDGERTDPFIELAIINPEYPTDMPYRINSIEVEKMKLTAEDIVARAAKYLGVPKGPVSKGQHDAAQKRLERSMNA